MIGSEQTSFLETYMADVSPPSVIVFDVNETLLDIETLEPLFVRLFGDRRILREWYAQLVLYSEALTLAGSYASFADLGGAVLRMVGDIRGSCVQDDDVAELRNLTLGMPAHGDVLDALGRLSDAGFRLVTLTNSAPDPTASPLERAGIAALLERQFSVDAVRRFKPAPETYRSVAEGLGVPLSALCMVAAHSWDTLGAQAAGCSAALVTRTGNAALPLPGLVQPDIVERDMGRVADAIIRLWGRA